MSVLKIQRDSLWLYFHSQPRCKKKGKESEWLTLASERLVMQYEEMKNVYLIKQDDLHTPFIYIKNF